ncbi:MAG: hypothetical protein Q8K02_08130 [Flavobacterium sp.]|nr:hypothetical protein [Flavobacterium sp.]
MQYDLTFTDTQEIMDYINSKTFENPESKRINEKKFCPFTWEEAVNFFVNGWPTSKKIKIQAENLEKSFEIPHGYKYNTTGEILDVGTFLTGKPECWLEPEMVDNRKLYKIVINSSYSCNVHQQNIINRGIAIVSLIDLLQDEGHIVELEIVETVKNIMDKNEFSIRFILGTSPLDIDKLSFMIANPAFLRRIIFAICETYFNTRTCYSYGSPTDAKIDEPNVIYFPCLYGSDYKFETIESAKNEVERILLTIKKEV